MKKRCLVFVLAISLIITSFVSVDSYALLSSLEDENLPKCGLKGVEVYKIDDETAENLKNDYLRSYQENLASSTEGVIDVDARDWGIYDDEYGYNKMTSAEKTLYRRIEQTSIEYISDSNLDATYLQKFNVYITKEIPYSDLGISEDRAVSVATWFKHNNPQYYFYQTRFIHSSKSVYISIYDAFSDGDDRASATNEVFDVVDGWVNKVNDNAITTYEKIIYANDLLCSDLSYNDNDFDQSLYSAAVLKSTVCAGYAASFCVVMNALLIPTSLMTSNTHGWNVTKFDNGNYYGVDVTWGDSFGDHRMIGLGSNDLCKYDSSSTSSESHVAVSPTTLWGPSYNETSYQKGALDDPAHALTLTPPDQITYYFDDEGTTAYVFWDKESTEYYEVKSDTAYLKLTEPAFSVKNIEKDTNYKFRIRKVNDTGTTKTYSEWLDVDIMYSEEESDSDTETESETETDSGSDSEDNQNSDTDTNTETESETETDSDSDSEDNQNSDSDTPITTDSDTETETETDSETQTDSDSDSEDNPNSDPDIPTTTDSDTETETDSEIETDYDSDSEDNPNSDPDIPTTTDSDTETDFDSDSEDNPNSDPDIPTVTDTDKILDTDTEIVFVIDTETETDTETVTDSEADSESDTDTDPMDTKSFEINLWAVESDKITVRFGWYEFGEKIRFRADHYEYSVISGNDTVGNGKTKTLYAVFRNPLPQTEYIINIKAFDKGGNLIAETRAYIETN